MYNTIPATNLNYKKSYVVASSIGENPPTFTPVNGSHLISAFEPLTEDLGEHVPDKKSRTDEWKFKVRKSPRSSVFLPETSEVSKPLTPHEVLDLILSRPSVIDNTSEAVARTWSTKIRGDISHFIHKITSEMKDIDFDDQFESRLANGIIKLRKPYTENDDITYVSKEPRKRFRFLKRHSSKRN